MAVALDCSAHKLAEGADVSVYAELLEGSEVLQAPARLEQELSLTSPGLVALRIPLDIYRCRGIADDKFVDC
jgi:hypothetical protein